MTYTPTAAVSRFVAWTVTTLAGVKLEPAKVAECIDAFRESLNDGLARLLVSVDRWLSARIDAIIRRLTMPRVKPVRDTPILAPQTPPEVEATPSPPLALESVAERAPRAGNASSEDRQDLQDGA